MNKIYYIYWDYAVYVDGKYKGPSSGEEGFWLNKPTDEEVAKYMLKKYPHRKKEIENGMKRLRGVNQVVWDIEEWERIDNP